MPRSSTKNRINNPAILAIFCLVYGLTFTAEEAHADRLYLLPPADQLAGDLQRARERRSDLSDEAVREMIYKPALIARLKEEIAPVQIKQDTRGTYIDGILIDYLIGPRTGNMADPDNHDTIVFLAQGQGGRRQAAEPFLVSALHVQVLQHTIDWKIDFVWEMSDRHVQMGVPFGSDAHRQAIYAIIDPDGWLDLYKGVVQPVQVNTEGRLINFLLNGMPSLEAFFGNSMWARSSPYFVFPDGSSGDWPIRELIRERFPPDAAINAIGRARRYNNFDPDVGVMATDLVKIICSFVLGDPVMASNSNQAVVERAFYVGVACRERISWIIEGTSSKSRGGVQPDTAALDFNHDQGAFPVTDDDLVDPLLRIIAEERSFRSFVGAEIDYMAGLLNEKTPFWQTSGLMIRALGGLAFDDGAGISPETRALARTAFVRLVSDLPGDPSEDAAEFEIDKRVYRRAFEDRHARDNIESDPWIVGLYCSIGWGHREDSRRWASRLMSNVVMTEDEKFHERALPDNLPPTADSIRGLILMQRNGNGSSADVALATYIDDWIRSHRELVTSSEGVEGVTDDIKLSRRIVSIYEELAAERAACPDIL